MKGFTRTRCHVGRSGGREFSRRAGRRAGRRAECTPGGAQRLRRRGELLRTSGRAAVRLRGARERRGRLTRRGSGAGGRRYRRLPVRACTSGGRSGGKGRTDSCVGTGTEGWAAGRWAGGWAGLLRGRSFLRVCLLPELLEFGGMLLLTQCLDRCVCYLTLAAF